MHIYLCRHGESYINLTWPNETDPEKINSGLTERGIAQAKALADWLGNEIPEVNAVYASTMQRTMETAEFVSKKFRQDVILDDRLREIGNNYHNHMAIPQKDLPGGYLDFPLNQKPFSPIIDSVENGESLAHFRTRVGIFLEEMIEKHKEETILIISHGGLINAFTDLIFNVGFYRRCFLRMDYTAVSHFEYDPDTDREPWRLHYLGQTTHLALNAIK
ncbi:MAG: histidine phosphatase family protein [Anaerolineae bacterium]|nr:histidine phosphatase family protein [Anaerolineae bacterium]